MGLKDGLNMLRMIRGPREIAQVLLPKSMRTMRVLNQGAPPQDAPTQGAEVIRALKGLRNQLKGDAYVAQGCVDYARLKEEEAYSSLKSLSTALIHVKPQDLKTDEEKIAFFINLYNVLMIHGVIELEIKRSVMEIPSFFSTVAYRLGDDLVTPDDIEHGILRRNAAHPTSHKRTFKSPDARDAWMPSYVDPRVHMALVCVAQSCPPVGFYSPQGLDAQLGMASANYVNAGVRVDHDAKTIHVSAIFMWYRQDFGSKQELGAFWMEHANDELKEDLERALKNAYEWSQDSYDWSLNTL